MKANPHPEILRTLHAEGISSECVSRGEVERVLEAVPGVDRAHILFTPNFAPRDEYEWAFAQGVRVTVDNSYVVEQWPRGVPRPRDFRARGYGHGPRPSPSRPHGRRALEVRRAGR